MKRARFLTLLAAWLSPLAQPDALGVRPGDVVEVKVAQPPHSIAATEATVGGQPAIPVRLPDGGLGVLIPSLPAGRQVPIVIRFENTEQNAGMVTIEAAPLKRMMLQRLPEGVRPLGAFPRARTEADLDQEVGQSDSGPPLEFAALSEAQSVLKSGKATVPQCHAEVHEDDGQLRNERQDVCIFDIVVPKETSTLKFANNTRVFSEPDERTISSSGHSVVYRGPQARKFDIVFLGDGFRTTPEDRSLFDRSVDRVVARLREFPPYSYVFRAFNFWKIHVHSKQAGTDDWDRNIERETAFDSYMHGRIVDIASPANAIRLVASYGLDPETMVVLVHDFKPAGGAAPADGLVFATISPLLERIITHEIGHAAGNLADEYDCYWCIPGTREPVLRRPSKEPYSPNVTLASTAPVPLAKWEVPPLGLIEGGYYRKTGVYRAEQNCHMRDTTKPFCRVCVAAIERNLEKYLP